MLQKAVTQQAASCLGHPIFKGHLSIEIFPSSTQEVFKQRVIGIAAQDDIAALKCVKSLKWLAQDKSASQLEKIFNNLHASNGQKCFC